MNVKGNPLMLLCDVATSILEKDTSISELQEQPVTTSAMHEQDTAAIKVRQKAKTTKNTVKSCALKGLVPCLKELNHRITEFMEDTSDELNRKFSYRCKFAPNVCSVTMESYGNETKALFLMKKHIKMHLYAELPKLQTSLIPETTNKAKRDIAQSSYNLKSTNKIFPVNLNKRFHYVETVKSLPIAEFDEDKSIPQQLTPNTDMEETFHVPLDTDDSTDFNGILNTIKHGEFEHTYAKHPDKPSNTISPVRETGQKKTCRQNIKLSAKYDINRIFAEAHLKGMRPVINTPSFPFVYTPYPLEAICNIELDSNGDPAEVKEPFVDQPSTSRSSFKRTSDNSLFRKNAKFVLAGNSSRSVLECVENRNACKSKAANEQKDTLLADNSIENSENVDKSMQDIAWKNIHRLNQQRKKRIYRDKPTVYICEVCKKHFTANTSLANHYLGHLNIKPFECDICKKTFTRRHSLKYHMMIHSNKNRFQCDACKRLFRHPSHYREHLRKHTGEEPFSCKFCSNKFKTRNSFKRHLKMQHQKLLTSNGIVPICNDS